MLERGLVVVGAKPLGAELEMQVRFVGEIACAGRRSSEREQQREGGDAEGEHWRNYSHGAKKDAARKCRSRSRCRLRSRLRPR